MVDNILLTAISFIEESLMKNEIAIYNIKYMAAGPLVQNKKGRNK